MSKSLAQINDWDVQKNKAKSKHIKDIFKNKIIALQHRMLLKENREIDHNKDFHTKVFNLRLALGILGNLSNVLSDKQMRQILERLNLRVSAVSRGSPDNI